MLSGQPAWTVHAAVHKVAEYKEDVRVRTNLQTGKKEFYVPQVGDDVEVCQMACEFPMRVVTEKQFRSAFDQMREACLKRAREAGMVLA